MGKKRIKDLGETSPDKKKRKIVKTGKEQGRLTDMSAVAVEEAALIKKKEKELEKAVQKAAKKATKKKPAKKRGKRYLDAKKQVDRNKLYPLSEAIKLLKKTSIARFKGNVELHLNVREKGLRRKVKLPHPISKEAELKIATEKKTPLIHLIIGKIDTKDEDLTANFQATINILGSKNIKKAVLTSTMGPGIKVDLSPMPEKPSN